MTLTALVESKHGETARLIHRSLVSWYETHLRQGKRFGDDPKPFGLFPEVYAALDPGQAIAACDCLELPLPPAKLLLPVASAVPTGRASGNPVRYQEACSISSIRLNPDLLCLRV